MTRGLLDVLFPKRIETKTTAKTKGPKVVSNNPKIALSVSDLNRLLVELDADIVTLAECVVSAEAAVAFPKENCSAIYYNSSGTGRLIVSGSPPVGLTPHTLVIVPAARSFRIEPDSPIPRATKEIRLGEEADGTELMTRTRYLSEAAEPSVRGICGYIHATYGGSIDIFKSLTSPIVERFDETSGVEENLKMAVVELVVREVGMRAMTAVLLKRVIVTILRRSIKSAELWTERFPILSDSNVARAFVAMLAEPQPHHTVFSLSQTAGLSRSAFMARFTNAIGLSPLAALKRLRMREAAGLLAANTSRSK